MDYPEVERIAGEILKLCSSDAPIVARGGIKSYQCSMQRETLTPYNPIHPKSNRP